MKHCRLDRGICSQQCGDGFQTGCMQTSYCENQIPDAVDKQAEQEELFSMYEKGLGAF